MQKPLLIYLFVLVSTQIFAEEIKITTIDFSNCGLDTQSIQLAKLIVESSGQQRKVLLCDKTLAQAAHNKAKDLAEFDVISHFVDHVSPNEHLKNEGILLPYDYEFIGNQVESILGGKETYQESFDSFMSSSPHKAHLLGESEFLVSQDHMGVGYYYKEKNKDYVHFWVVYITSFRNKDDKMKIFTTGKPTFYFVPREKRKRKKKVNRN